VTQWLAIGLGGALGALARWLVSDGMHRWLGRDFPWGTLAVNLAGSLAMGLLAVLLVERFAPGPALRAGLLVGFLGAFTTFSTFALETVQLASGAFPLRAALYALASVAGCVAAALVGVLLARQIVA
jgi:CrcB protein